MSVTVITKTPRLPISSALVRKVVTRTLQEVGLLTSDVSVQLCNDAEVKKLNTRYRGKESTTDVLSFPTDPAMGGDKNDLGDLVLSVPQIIRQANLHHIQPKEECIRMLIHGTLHLSGYNHESDEEKKNMFIVQEKLVLAICA